MKHHLLKKLSHLLTVAALTVVAAITPSVTNAQVEVTPDPNVTVISNSQCVIGNDTTTYSNYNIQKTRIDTLTIKGTTVKLTLIDDTIGTIIIEEMEKAITLKIEGKVRIGSIINNARTTLVQSNGYAVLTGTIENNGVLINEDGMVRAIDKGRTQMSLTGLLNGSYEKGGSFNMTATANYQSGKRTSFIWQKKNDKNNVYETVIQKDYILSFDDSKSFSITDTLTISEGSGSYRCLVTDSTNVWKICSRIAVYGAVEELDAPLFGTVIFKTFKNGHIDGFDGKSDVYFYFTKDQQISFTLYDYDGNMIEEGATVKALYVKGNDSTTIELQPNESHYYTLMHVNDSVFVNITIPSPQANEAISMLSAVRVWGSNGTLHIRTPKSVTAYIVTFDGRVRPVKASSGDTQFYLGKGLFIIRIGDKSWKLVL